MPPSYRLLPMASVKTSVVELPESRVRVQAEVPADEVERRVQQAARKLGNQMRVPGFRKGKVPPTVVLRRLGREAVLDEALREALGTWYVDAIDGAGIAPIGDPDLDVGDLPAQGEPLSSRSRSASGRAPSWAPTRALRSASATPRSQTRRSTPSSSAYAIAWRRSTPLTVPRSPAITSSSTTSVASTASRSRAARAAIN